MIGMEMEATTPAQTLRRGRGRPRAFQQDHVLDAALELFWREGYRNTTTRDLESSLGLSQSSLYNTFGSKQGLLEAVLDRYESSTDRQLVHPLEESRGDGLAALDAFFVGLARWVTRRGKRGCMLINMMAEDGTTTEAITKRSRAYRSRVRAGLLQGLECAAGNGESSPGELEERADLLLGVVLGFNIAARGGASKAELGRLLGAVRSQIESWRARPVPSSTD